MKWAWCVAPAIVLAAMSEARADLRSKAATEAAEYVAKKFGKEAVKEGVEAFAKRIATAAAKHGDDVFAAIRKLGPRALHAVEEAGEHGGKMARLISRFEDDALVWVAKRPKAMSLLAKHGEEAGAVLIKHKGIAEALIEQLGDPAVNALAKVGSRSGRRISIMEATGDLAKIGRTARLLDTVSRFGERAVDFIWKNKGKLASAALLTAFLADPEPFILGTKELIEPVLEVPAKMMESVVAPLAQAPAKAMTNISEEMGKRTNWTVILSLLTVGGLSVLGLRTLRKHRGQTLLGLPQPEGGVPR